MLQVLDGYKACTATSAASDSQVLVFGLMHAHCLLSIPPEKHACGLCRVLHVIPDQSGLAPPYCKSLEHVAKEGSCAL